MMNHKSYFSTLALALGVLITLLAPGRVFAATLYWSGDATTQGGGGTWDVSTANWSAVDGGPFSSIWDNLNNDTALFTNAAGVVTLGAPITVGGLQFDTAGYVITNNTLTFGAAGNIAVNSAASSGVIISSVLDGSVAIQKTGTGDLTFTNNNTYTGALTLNGGRIIANTSANALGTGAATLTLTSGTLVFNDTANRAFNRNTTVNGDVTISASRSGSGAGLGYILGALGIGANTLIVGAGNANSGTAALTVGNITLGGNAVFTVNNGSGSAVTFLTNSGTLSDGGSGYGITKSGGGTLVLSGTNTYSGTTTLSAGTLLATTSDPALTPAKALGTNSLALNGGTLQLRASGTLNTTAETITLGNNTTVSGTATIDVNRPGATSTTKTIALGTLSIGAQTLSVTGGNTYGLRFAGITSLTGAATFNPTTAPLTLSAVTIDDTVATGTTNTITVGGSGNTTVNGIISNNGTDNTKVLALTKSGAGTLNMGFNVTNTYTGGTTISNGSVGNAFAKSFGTGDITFSGSSTVFLTPVRTDSGLGVAGYTFTNNLAVSPGATVSLLNGNQFTSMINNGALSGSGTVILQTGAGGAAGFLTFANANNTFTGTIQVNSTGNGGGTLNVNSLADSANPIGFSTASTSQAIFSLNAGTAAPLLFNSRQIQLNGGAFGLIIDNSNATATNTITINSGLVVSVTGSKTLTLQGGNTGSNAFNGKITNGTSAVISVTKAGTGTWALGGTNTYTGVTTISAGTLTINSITNVGAGASALGAPTTVTNGAIAAGSGAGAGTLKYIGTDTTTDRAINLASTSTGGAVIDQSGTGLLKFTADIINTNTGAKTFTLQGSTTGMGEFAGAIINGPGTTNLSLTKSGTSIWILSGTNTYKGVTTVNAGTLLVNGNSSATTNTVNVLTNATFGGTGTVGGLVRYQKGSLALFAVTPEAATAYSNSTYMTFTNAAFLTNVTVKVDMPAGLGNGTYVLATNYVTPVTSGSLTFATNSGSLGASGSGVVSVSGNNLILTVSGVTGGSTYTVTYDGNGSTGGGVPTDGAAYSSGATVTVLGNTNSLVKTGYNFAGWTNAVGTPTTAYSAGNTFSITANTTLNARWFANGYPTLTNSVSGSTLSLSWPAGEGWRLQQQTNSLSVGLGTNWVYVTDSSVSSTNITTYPTNPTVFYRLVYP